MENIYRGKSFDLDEWTYGSLQTFCETTLGCGNIYYIIDKFTQAKTEVIPRSVGQSINLTDKENQPAYVGDIIKDMRNRLWVIICVPGGFGLCRDTEYKNRNSPCFIHEALSDMQSASFFNQTCKIVGNIYENPELIPGLEVCCSVGCEEPEYQ